MSVSFMQHKRAMVASIVGAVAFLGFWVGIRQRPEAANYKSYAEESDPGEAEPARTNEELASNPWSSSLPKWSPSLGPAAEPITTKDKDAYLAALDARSGNRAFEGAPPTIPHPIGQGSAKECLLCHGSGATIGEVTAPLISHTVYTSCTQCHVPALGSLPIGSAPTEYFLDTANSFVGLREAPAPWKMAEGSPPRQPHTTLMRENCQSCHGSHGRPGLQSSHPERKSCQQCHAPPARIDQRFQGPQ